MSIRFLRPRAERSDRELTPYGHPDNNDGTPNKYNHRYQCAKTMEAAKSHDPWVRSLALSPCLPPAQALTPSLVHSSDLSRSTPSSALMDALTDGPLEDSPDPRDPTTVVLVR